MEQQAKNLAQKKDAKPLRMLGGFLREPGARAASQVLFWNTFNWEPFRREAAKGGGRNLKFFFFFFFFNIMFFVFLYITCFELWILVGFVLWIMVVECFF